MSSSKITVLGLRACFLLLSALAGYAAIIIVQQGFNVQTNLQALLPDHHFSAAARLAHQNWIRQGEHQLIIALSHPEAGIADQSGQLALGQMQSYSWMQPLEWQRQAEQLQQSDHQLFNQFRQVLLSNQHRDWLANGDYEQIQQYATRKLYGIAEAGQQRIANDPLSLFSAYQEEQQPLPSGLMIRNGLLAKTGGSDSHDHHVLLVAEILGSPYSLPVQDQLRTYIDQLRESLAEQFPDVQLTYSGVVFHASEATQQTRREIQLIAAGSTLGILLLFLLTFRSLRPLLLSIFALAYGCFCAVVLCHWYFGKLHLITLVFGASLIGVAIDYSLHYFAHRDDTEPPAHTLFRILPSIGLALSTTAIGYAYLTQAPLPGLHQIASFCVIGLAATWLFVACLYPPLSSASSPTPPAWISALYQTPDRFWSRLSQVRTHVVIGMIAFLATLIVVGTVEVSDDIRTLYRPSADRIAADRFIQGHLNIDAPNQFFILNADSEQALLEREEQFRIDLEDLLTQGHLNGYSAASQSLPSVKTQMKNRTSQQAMYAVGSNTSDWLKQLGFDNVTLERLSAQFDQPFQPMDLPDWLEVATSNQKALWLGRIGQQYHSVIRLSGIRDIEPLQQLAERFQGVDWVDQVATISAHLSDQRQTALFALTTAYVLIAILLWLRYRDIRASFKIAVPVCASVLALAVLSLLGFKIGLFHIFGLFLVLGLGMDYSIFLTDSTDRQERQRSLLAIGLSATTSILSFGLLSFSSAPMIQAFGLTVLLGSLFNLLLSASLTAGRQ